MLSPMEIHSPSFRLNTSIIWFFLDFDSNWWANIFCHFVFRNLLSANTVPMVRKPELNSQKFENTLKFFATEWQLVGKILNKNCNKERFDSISFKILV